MKKRILLVFLMLALVLVLLTGCLPGDGKYVARPAGFLSGVWHGWIAPVSLIVGIFDHNIRVYEPINTGWWYDLGFYIAVISGFGGLSLSRRARRRHHED